MYVKRMPNLEIENAILYTRNFSGRPNQYNDEGSRNFCVKISDPETAQQMTEDGWNVKVSRHSDEDEGPIYYIPVAVDFSHSDRYPVSIYLYTKKRRKLLSEEELDQLDGAEFSNVDLLIRPRVWDDGGKVRIKAYLKEMHATLEENRFSEKYASYEYPEDDDTPF